MTSWMQPKDLRMRLEKKWLTGKFLSQGVSSEPCEPLRIPLKHPTTSQLTHQFEAVRTWIDQWVRSEATNGKKGYIIQWRDINHRTLGRNKLPVAVIFNSLTDIAAYLGKEKDARRFQALFHDMSGRFPELANFLRQKPMDVLKHDGSWDKLLSIVAHMKAQPRPGIYIRQLDIAGVDTKFIETHKLLLSKLLDCALSPDAIDQEATGLSKFEQRFGFLDKPARIRFRIIDPAMAIMGLTDLEIPAMDFCRFSQPANTVFIVENEINGLAFPPVPKALVIFGLGYSLSTLAPAQWLSQADIVYWGDIDTHGFAMLDQIRHYFPHTRSLLMDETTLLAHKDLWGSEPSPICRDLPLLTASEKNVYDALVNNTLSPSLRLEQERIAYAHVRHAVCESSRDPKV